MDVEVTQATSTTTGVTAEGACGIITCFTSTLAGVTSATFTVTNHATDDNSAIFLTIVNYSGTTGSPVVRVNNRVAGTSFDIIVSNYHATVALNGILKIAFLLQ